MTLFDFHLHWYPGFDPAGLRNRLERVTAEAGADGLVGVIHDTERVVCWDQFQKDLREGGFDFEVDEGRIEWQYSKGKSAYFFRGFQCVSEENIELLVLGSVPGCGALEAMVAEADSAGAAVIVPWGFGKWTGSRRAVLEKVLELPRSGLFLGDSANRWNGGSGGGLFARFSGIPRLDGSDPLPIPGDESFAFAGGMRGSFPAGAISTPMDFAAFLRGSGRELSPVCSGTKLREAVRRQIRLRRKPLQIIPDKPPAAPGESDQSDLESSSERYARRFSGEVGKAFLARQGSITLALAEEMLPKDGARGTILDVGGGHAQLAPLFWERGCKVTIFGSDESCRIRPDRLLGPENYAFDCGNLLKLPYPADSFDVVVAFRLVTHESQWETLIGELCRVARKAVIVDYPDVRGFNALSRLLFHLKKGFEKDTREYAVFNRRRISEAFERQDAGAVVFRPQFFLPMVFHRITGSVGILRFTEGFFRAVGLTRLFGSPVIARALPNQTLKGGQSEIGNP